MLDLKEISALKVCKQYHDSIPEEMFVAKGCKDCNRYGYEPYELRTKDPGTWLCLFCNFTPWLEEHKLPKELEGYCMNILKDWKTKIMYFQEFLPKDIFGSDPEWSTSDLSTDPEDWETSDESEQMEDYPLD